MRCYQGRRDHVLNRLKFSLERRRNIPRSVTADEEWHIRLFGFGFPIEEYLYPDLEWAFPEEEWRIRHLGLACIDEEYPNPDLSELSLKRNGVFVIEVWLSLMRNGQMLIESEPASMRNSLLVIGGGVSLIRIGQILIRIPPPQMTMRPFLFDVGSP
jgi:hypothetical protein